MEDFLKIGLLRRKPVATTMAGARPATSRKNATMGTSRSRAKWRCAGIALSTEGILSQGAASTAILHEMAVLVISRATAASAAISHDHVDPYTAFTISRKTAVSETSRSARRLHTTRTIRGDYGKMESILRASLSIQT